MITVVDDISEKVRADVTTIGDRGRKTALINTIRMSCNSLINLGGFIVFRCSLVSLSSWLSRMYINND